MTDEKITRDFLRQHGVALVEQGYTVVPIQHGKKAPGFDGWQKAKGTTVEVHDWLENGFKNAGVGILTKFTCAIDIDCRDEETALFFESWCLENIGTAPVRVGNAPKRLLLYRTTEPFSKRSSDAYMDEWGEKQQIEILGNGQQFVAFHIHPDTGRPYVWLNGVSPLNTRATALTELTGEQVETLIAEFTVHAEKKGWNLAKKGRAAPRGAIDLDNPWIEDSTPVELSTDELRTRLLMVPGCDDYDTWFKVGMSLYHQFDGEEEGFDLWNEWSEAADNYDRDSLERHWSSFGIDGKKKAPLTARFILRLSKEAAERTSQELSVKLKDAFLNAKDLSDWGKAVEMAREAEIDGLSRSALAAVAKDRRDVFTGTKTPLSEIRKAIAYLPKKTDDIPSWAEGWVYDTSDDKFMHCDKKITCTKQGFDAMHDRYALTKKDIIDGKHSPSQSASAVALNVYRIKTVAGRRYMPGRDAIFHEVDGTFANTYPEHEMPEKPEKVLPRDVRNIERVKAHIAHLLKNPVEQRMLMDWLSWVVQNPGQHANYSVLLQGVQGDGKSFFGELMRVVMGVSNVSMANASTITDSAFTDFAYGQCLTCVEEVRIVGKSNGHDKWAAINRIKPFITNHIIEVHPKGSKAFSTVNMTSYLMFSNYKDALPLDDTDRRHLVLFSRWQRKDKLDEFSKENPRYYRRLYDTLTESPGALRQWFLEHEQDESFDPKGVAPTTGAKATMIYRSQPEFIQVLSEIVDSNEEVAVCADLVDLTALQDIMTARGVSLPSGKALASMLERAGYGPLGRFRGTAGCMGRFYSRSPELFTKSEENGSEVTDVKLVRTYLAKRSLLFSSDL